MEDYLCLGVPRVIGIEFGANQGQLMVIARYPLNVQEFLWSRNYIARLGGISIEGVRGRARSSDSS